MTAQTTLGAFLDRHGYSEVFQQDHLLPMAAAIWSASADRLRAYPAQHFIRFCDNYGLLKFIDRPVWRMVAGGSREYVSKLLATVDDQRLGQAARRIRRNGETVVVRGETSNEQAFDHVVLACHADQALAMLDNPSDQERALLGAFGYTRNHAVLHGDTRLMPRRRAVWASWNDLGSREQADKLQVTYWMNRLQGLIGAPQLFVTLNPAVQPAADTVLHEELYDHPLSMLTQCLLSSSFGHCRVVTAHGSAGLISVQAFTKMVCHRGWRSQSNWAVFAALVGGGRKRPHHRHAGGSPRTGCMTSALYNGVVVHQRFKPRRHRLRYRLAQMLFDLDAMPRLRLFSHNRFNTKLH